MLFLALAFLLTYRKGYLLTHNCCPHYYYFWIKYSFANQHQFQTFTTIFWIHFAIYNIFLLISIPPINFLKSQRLLTPPKYTSLPNSWQFSCTDERINSASLKCSVLISYKYFQFAANRNSASHFFIYYILFYLKKRERKMGRLPINASTMLFGFSWTIRKSLPNSLYAEQLYVPKSESLTFWMANRLSTPNCRGTWWICI